MATGGNIIQNKEMDNKLLETRLLTRESVIGGSVTSSVLRCASKFRAFVEVLKSDESAAAYDNLCRELLLYKLDIEKVERVFAACDEQISSYRDIEREIEQQISSAKSHIGGLEMELDQEKKLRLHREGLEGKAAEVNALPSRKVLKRKIDDSNAGLLSLDSLMTSVDGRIVQRHKQFSVLLQAISDLQSKLQEEEEVALDLVEEEAEEEEELDQEGREDGRANRRVEVAAPKTTEEGEGEAEEGGECGEEEENKEVDADGKIVEGGEGEGEQGSSPVGSATEPSVDVGSATESEIAMPIDDSKAAGTVMDVEQDGI